MDSFICGTCNKTFHELEEFAEHKKIHKSQVSLASDSSVQEVSQNETHITVSSTSSAGSIPTSTSGSENTSKASTSQSKKFQTFNISQLKNFPLSSHARRSSSHGGKLLNVFQPVAATCRGVPKHAHSKKKAVDQQDLISSSLPSLSRSEAVENRDGHTKAVSSSQKEPCHQVSKENCRVKQRLYEGKNKKLSSVACDNGMQTLKAEDNSICIYESEGSNTMLGYLILEDTSKNDTVCIEISDVGGKENNLTSSICVDNCRSENGILGSDVCEMSDGVLEVKSEDVKPFHSDEMNVSHGTHLNKDCFVDNVERLIALKPNSNLKEGDEKTTFPSTTFGRKNELKVDLESGQNKNAKGDENSIVRFEASFDDYPSENNERKERIAIEIEEIEEPANQSATYISAKKEDEESHESHPVFEEGKEITLPVHPECDAPVVGDEVIDIMDSNLILTGNEATTISSSSALYTLVMNADSSFMLLGAGCNGSTAGPNGRIYVCHLCKKFSSSHLEILNHVSHCHPEDLVDVNRCIGEFSLLSGPENDAVNMDVNQAVMGNGSVVAGSNSKGSDAKPVPGENDGPSLREGNVSAAEESRTKAKRKVGRPRKEDRVNSDDQDKISVETRSFVKEGDHFVCTNCQKCFPKHRQFDKHKCQMWKENHLSFVGENLNSVSAGNEGSEEYLPHHNKAKGVFKSLFKEEECEEEWKANRRYKPKVKIKGRARERRKRGRPPKLDSLVFKATSCDTSDVNRITAKDVTLSSSPKDKDTHEGTVSLQPLSSSSASPQPVGGRQSLNSIPTVPLFSNAQQQERLRKWIAQIDLSVVDRIIDKIYPEGSESQEGTEMYMCRKCKVLFHSLVMCRRHCAKHLSHKAFTCPDCDFATVNISALYTHYRNHTQNLYACDKCDFRARLKAHFRDHLESHSPSRYICRLCQRPYSTSSSLRSHIYLYHSNKDGMKYLWSLREKNQECRRKNVFFQCPVCNKLFGEKSSANWHLATHSLSTSKDFMKCEVCDAETLNSDILRKHIQKHKVVYICCVCHKPQVTANCLRRHQRGECTAPQPESFRRSILLSFTAPETFPTLLANKKIGPLLRDTTYCQLSKGSCSADSEVSESLKKQMDEVGYKQICQLIQGLEEGESLGNQTERTISDVMKIIVDTRYTGESDHQVVALEQHHIHPNSEHLELHHREVLQQEYFEEVVESITCSSRDQEVPFGGENGQRIPVGEGGRGEASPVYLPDEDSMLGESDQRVVVISNMGEEQQTVVIEDGHMMTSEEERLVIISNESVDEQHVGFRRFLIDDK